MKNSFGYFIGALVLCIVVWSCKETVDATEYANYKKYTPMHVGKYFIYRLDSTVMTNFGQAFVTRTYTIKDSVVESFTDNEGNESFKIYRYLQNPSGSWYPVNTFFATPKANRYEYVENNLRYIKLTNPINVYTNWYGNSYIPTSPYYDGHQFDTWRFGYSDIGASKTFGANTYSNTITVVQKDSSDNAISYSQLVATPAQQFQSHFYDHGYEVYADSVGLVYSDFFAWNYQFTSTLYNCKYIRPNTTGGYDTSSVDCQNISYNCDSLSQVPGATIKCDTALNGYHFDGYGVKQTLISHN